MQAAYMFMIQTLFAPDKDFPERPVAFLITWNNIATSFIFRNISVIELS